MPSELPRPPRKIGPAAFLTQYLPGLWARLTHDAALPWPEGNASIAVHIDDEAFGLTFAATGLTGSLGAPSAPLITVRTDRAAFRIACTDVLRRILDFTDASLQRAHAALRGAAADPALTDLVHVLAPHHGQVRLVYTDDAGDEATCDIDLGTGAGPRVTLHLGDADLDAVLQAGKRGLLKVVQGRIRLDGDTAYALKLAKLLVSGAP